MVVREPVVAGTFYPGREAACRAELAECLPASPPQDLPGRDLVGGVVPHAGWVFSGSVAGLVFSALAERGRSMTYVLFGAVHRGMGSVAAVSPRGAWRTPLGEIEIDESLADDLLTACPGLTADDHAHALEHSLEVQVPFIQHLSPDARIVPIMVAPTDQAANVGREVGQAASGSDRSVVFVGSSDLTHYGPRYGFAPHGTGEKGLTWAKEVNDRSMIDCLLAMREDDIVSEARRNSNACGAGALAATAAACKAGGAEKGILLAHRTSAEVESTCRLTGGVSPEDAVGYAGVVYV